MIRVGQIWEFTGSHPAHKRKISSKKEVFQLTSPLTVIEIMTINKSKPNGIIYHACSLLRDDNTILTLALKDSDGHIIMIPDMFKEAIDDGEWFLILDSTGITKPKIGATCSQCKKDYPYADYADDFECWSCKNGF